MNPAKISFLAAILVVAGAAIPAQAQTKQEDFILQGLFRRLSKILVPLGRDGGPDKTVALLMANPGLSVPSNYNPTDNQLAAKDLNLMINQVPMVSPIFTPTGTKTYTDVYKTILYNNTAVQRPLKDAEKARMKELEAIVAEDGPLMKAYYEARDKYFAACEAQAEDAWEKTRQGRLPSNTLKTKVQDARKPYEKCDGDLKRAWKEISEFQNGDTFIWLESLKDRFDEHKLSTGNYDTNFFPPVESWKGDGWTKFKYSTVETKKYEKEKDLNVQAAASVTAGKFSGSLAIGYAATAQANAGSTDDTTIEFELKRVYIMRNYMDGQIFSNSSWKFNDTNRFYQVSNGQPWDSLDGNMPLLTTTLILCKNLKIKGKWVSEFKHLASREITAEGKVSYGPFTATAKVRDYQKEGAEGSKLDENELGDDGGMQIVAMLATIVPLCPNYIPPSPAAQ